MTESSEAMSQTLTKSPDGSADEQDQTSDPSDAQTLSPNEIFHILQNDRRRGVLRFLQGRDDPVRMRDVAEQVAAWEHDTTVQGLSSTQRQRVYIPLYQSHLPKLDELGVIEYQQSRGIVERKPLADVFDPYLDVESEATQDSIVTTDVDEWDDHYLAAAAIGSVLLLGAVLELPLLGTLPGITVAILMMMLLVFLTAKRHVVA